MSWFNCAMLSSCVCLGGLSLLSSCSIRLLSLSALFVTSSICSLLIIKCASWRQFSTEPCITNLPSSHCRGTSAAGLGSGITAREEPATRSGFPYNCLEQNTHYYGVKWLDAWTKRMNFPIISTRIVASISSQFFTHEVNFCCTNYILVKPEQTFSLLNFNLMGKTRLIRAVNVPVLSGGDTTRPLDLWLLGSHDQGWVTLLVLGWNIIDGQQYLDTAGLFAPACVMCYLTDRTPGGPCCTSATCLSTSTGWPRWPWRRARWCLSALQIQEPRGCHNGLACFASISARLRSLWCCSLPILRWILTEQHQPLQSSAQSSSGCCWCFQVPLWTS